MNSQQIEKLAISYLTNTLENLDYITTEFASNDKSPSWDGYIYLYNDKDNFKKDLLRKKLPVQIKGKYKKPPYNQNITYSVKISDLRNYFNDNGVIFFIIYLDENNNHNIYYQVLTKIKLKYFLKTTDNKDSLSLIFQKLPTKKENIIDIFFNFAKDSNYTVSSADVSLDDFYNKKIPGFNQLRFSYEGIAYKNQPYRYFFEHPTTLTIYNSDLELSIPIGEILLDKIQSNRLENIYVGNRLYYKEIKIEENIGHFIIKLGKSIEFDTDFNNKQLNLNFHIVGNLNERILALDFLITLLKEKKLIWGNQIINFDKMNSKKINLDGLTFYYDTLKKIRTLLNNLYVPTVLDYDDISEEQEKMLFLLVDAVLKNHEVKINSKNDYILYEINIANINILLIAIKNKSGNYNLYNFFSNKNEIKIKYINTDNNTVFDIPVLFLIEKKQFEYINNLDYQTIENCIKNSQTSSNLKILTYQYMERMINGYKRRKEPKQDFYNCIIQLLDFLTKNNPEYDYISLKNKL